MSLIHRAKIDSNAFAKLYEEHVQAVYQYFKVRLNSRMQAEDLTSTVWESVLKNIQHLNSNKPVVFRAWLFTIARNALNKFLSEKYTEKIIGLTDEHEKILSIEKDPKFKVEASEEADQILILIDALPEEQRETVILRYYSDLKNKEIAKVLCVSQKTVASNLSRALKTLQDRLKNLQ